jgi:hypothetical protein
MKIARLREFFNDHGAWPLGCRYEGVEFVVCGRPVKNPLELTAEDDVEISGGYTLLNSRGQVGPAFEVHVQAWLEMHQQSAT